MAAIEMKNIVKKYADGFAAVNDVSLDIAEGEFMILVGPSGCGKSTLLRMIVGLEDISSGDMMIGGKRVNNVAPRERNLAMVFQNYALYPHLSVFENIAFPLRLRGKLPESEVREKVETAAATLELQEHLQRKPSQLSGGQRQRVAMGRAIVREADAFLFDEPLSNLDAKLRGQMRMEILRMQRRMGTTTVYVTHDQTEAMTLGDRVAVLRAGVLQQIASPQELYDRPANMQVAGFIGAPGMNLIAATLAVDGAGAAAVAFGGHRLSVPPGVLHRRPALRRYDGRKVAVGIRPEDMSDAELSPGAEGTTLHSVADLVEAMGADVMVHFPVDAEAVRTADRESLERESGAVGAPASGTVLVARFSPRTRLFEGQPTTVRVDVENLHFFDLETGLAIGR